MKKLLLTLLFTGLVSAAADTGLLTPVKSPNDPRDYGAFVLPNGMKVLLISDPHADKAAASLSIHVGSASEPADRPGLAHFLEHMLFMGTKKYPDVSAYQKYITDNGGEDNAYTQNVITNFSFTVKPDRLEGALDRFSQFFIVPLFDAHYVEREKHAVDSEYQLKRKKDIRRIGAALKQAYNPASPYSRFTVGNLQTLADRPGDTLRDALIRFYESYYSADIMALTVLGREPLPALKKMIEKYFSEVKKKQVSPYSPTPSTWALSEDRVPAALAIRPLSEMHRAVLLYPVPAQLPYYKTNPYAYLSTLLANASPGSFYDIAHRRGWLEALSISGDDNDAQEGVFQVDMGLSPQGLVHLEELMQLFYAYVQKVRQEGIVPWRYEEQQRLSALSFRYAMPQAPFGYVTGLSDRLQRYPAEQVLIGGRVLQQYDEAVLRQYLDALRPERALNVIIDPSMPTDKIEKWYQTPYAYKKLTEAETKKMQESPKGIALSLPPKNPYIPNALTLKPLPPQAAEIPQRILSEPGFTLWHKQDSTFKAPRASVTILLRAPAAADNPTDAAALQLWTLLLADKLDPVRQQAVQAGLGFAIQSSDEGLSIQLFGYDEKLPALLEQLLKAIADERVDSQRFSRLKRIYAQELANSRHALPFQQVMQAVLRSVAEGVYSPKVLYEAVALLTPEKLQAYKQQFLQKLEVEMLTLGNLTEAESRKMAEELKQILLSQSTLTAVKEPATLLPQQDRVREILYPVAHPDAVVIEGFMGAETDADSWARWNLLSQLIKGPFSTELRTKQQLGYVVLADAFSQRNNPGLILVVESSNTPAGEVAKRMAAFRQAFGSYLSTLDSKSFETAKAGLIAILSRKDTSLADRTGRYLSNLLRKQRSFDFDREVAAAVKKLDLQTLVKFYQEEILAHPRRIIGISKGTGSTVSEQNSSHPAP